MAAPATASPIPTSAASAGPASPITRRRTAGRGVRCWICSTRCLARFERCGWGGGGWTGLVVKSDASVSTGGRLREREDDQDYVRGFDLLDSCHWSIRTMTAVPTLNGSAVLHAVDSSLKIG